ncbi:nuclear transport factor 2 family protein [Alkalimonas delamerensis]|uniref:Nuclear transport factor 2 family protein n=1 Tax=Alkalimonas delamerensis TaxID=265981 RepID=A0ABT9GMU6_9GAMM|nr:nuclear transport factor 2 family protein [Alkalimonas delamerensis]MDP4528289.1 nuclear transport factor 2 family protein [Alkalimonas delamerensis]
MKYFVFSLSLLVLLLLAPAASANNDKADITALLHQFLAGASRNDEASHQGFWADDLVYTSSAGTRFGKATLMQGVRSSGPVADADIHMHYSAENIQVRLYGDVAVLNFILLGNSDAEQLRFYNSGVLQRLGDSWQVISWQATRAAD